MYPAEISAGTTGHWQLTISEKLLMSEGRFVVGPGQYQIGEEMIGFSINPTSTETRYDFSADPQPHANTVACSRDLNYPSPLPGWDSNEPLSIYLKATPK
jgi:hypothetical protein